METVATRLQKGFMESSSSPSPLQAVEQLITHYPLPKWPCFGEMNIMKAAIAMT
jgi:hypothetical protein